MKQLRIPLLCKERVGEVESGGYQLTITGSTIEGSAEATSPLPLPTKEGTLEQSTLIFTHANVEDPKSSSEFNVGKLFGQ